MVYYNMAQLPKHNATARYSVGFEYMGGVCYGKYFMSSPIIMYHSITYISHT